MSQEKFRNVSINTFDFFLIGKSQNSHANGVAARSIDDVCPPQLGRKESVMLTMDFVTDPGHWRDRAKSIRVTAQSLDDDDAKVRMLKIAEGYEALSRQSEESRDPARQNRGRTARSE